MVEEQKRACERKLRLRKSGRKADKLGFAYADNLEQVGGICLWKGIISFLLESCSLADLWKNMDILATKVNGSSA